MLCQENCEIKKNFDKVEKKLINERLAWNFSINQFFLRRSCCYISCCAAHTFVLLGHSCFNNFCCEVPVFVPARTFLVQHFFLQCSYLFSCQDILVVTLPIAKFLSLFLQGHSCCNISFCDVPVFFPTRSFLSLYSSCKVPVFVPTRIFLLHHLLLRCSCLFSCQVILGETFPAAKFLYLFLPGHSCWNIFCFKFLSLFLLGHSC